jgi:guanine nucleotide-binding protein alpha-1 subunit
MTTLFKAKRSIREAISAYQDPSEDPLTKALEPAPDESEEERLRRLESIQAAQKVSQAIDAEILESKKLLEKKNKAIKILLLGRPSIFYLFFR